MCPATLGLEEKPDKRAGEPAVLQRGTEAEGINQTRNNVVG